MNRRAYRLAFLIVILTVSTLFVPASLTSVGGSTTSSTFSWNPMISCTPLVVRITDITANQTGSQSFSSSPFTPGITTTVTGGEVKRWLTPGPTPPGWVSPGPPCTVTNSRGTTSLFVQINGVERNDLTTEDYATSYDVTNGGTAHALTGDTTFNLFDPAVVPHYFTSCTSSTDLTCYGRIHAEIDHDWKAAGYCGSGTFCDNATLASQTTVASTMIDVQGFISWDPGNLNSSWHQFSGWEIHPLTAWKLSSTPPPGSVDFSWSPTNPLAGQTVAFTATTSNGTSPSSFNWNFGDGVTASGSNASHMYVADQAFVVHVTMTDTQGNTAAAQKVVTVGSWNPAVACSPARTTLGGVIGNISIQRVSSNSNSLGADYSGGGFKLDGSLPYGSNPTTWPFFKRDLQLPCSASGTPAFVEFHNVTVTDVSVDDCSRTYSSDNGGGSYPNGWQSCDTTFNLVTPGFGDDATCPGCYMHRVYAGIDRDWNASGVAPLPRPLDGQRIDVQGFVYWSNDFVNASWHSYSGWEIHPVAAWRLALPTVAAGISFSPSNPTGGQTVDFSGTASGGSASYSFTWDFGDGKVATGNPVGHVYAPGSYVVHMAATDSLGTIGVAFQNVLVTGPLGFTVSASPSSLMINAGKTNSSTIILVSINGFSGNISLSSSITPAGLTASLSPGTVTLVPNGSGNSVLSVTATPTALPGTYNVIVTGVSGNLTQNVQVPVSVLGPPTFILSANPARLVIVAGYNGKDNITVTSFGGFKGTVQLTTSGAPGGVKLTLNPTSVTLSAGGTALSVLTVSAATNSLAGNYTLTVTGSGGGTTRKITLTLTINSDFTISANPTSLTIVSGSSKSSTISLKSFGFKGTITLSLSVSDPSVSATISPASLTFSPGQTQSAILKVTSKTAGTYTVTVIATSGSLTHSITVPIAITDFTISASPASLTLTAGSTGQSTVALTSLDGFAGTVKLTDTVTPSGLKVTLSTTSIALTAGGTGSSLLTISSTTTTPPGNYTIVMTATAGGLVHTITILVTVTA